MDGENEKKPSTGGVYGYIEENYKEAWLQENQQDNFFADIGILSANRWEQFESNYRVNYAEHSANHPSVQQIYDERMAERQEREDLYCRLYTSASKRKDMYQDEEVKAEVMQEAQEYVNLQISDGAALETFTSFGMDVMLMDSETVRKEAEAAQADSNTEKNEVTLEEMIKMLEEKAQRDNGANLEYLVRGAPLHCLYGSHTRYLDMLETHGVSLKDKPLIHETDAVVGENIFPFGLCRSPCCTLTEVDSLMKGAEVDGYGNYLKAPDDQVMTGIICKPTIKAGGWKNVKDDVKIADNATPASKTPEDCVCFSVATDASYLLCREGGIISPVTSGQLEFSAFRPPYLDYPFPDIGSPAFFKWCKEEKICPYYPGVAGYNEWHQNKINGLMKESKKEAKAAYEEYLAGAYLVGLDQMPKKERDTVRSMVEQYLESGLVKEKNKEEVKAEYSGLRFDYGYNTQKNLTDYTPEQAGFYDYYLEQAEGYRQELDELNAEFMKLAGEESSMAGSVLSEMNSLREERDKAHERFAREIVLYSETLDNEKKQQVQEVNHAFGKGQQ